VRTLAASIEVPAEAAASTGRAPAGEAPVPERRPGDLVGPAKLG